jgi:hypothetical protein
VKLPTVFGIHISKGRIYASGGEYSVWISLSTLAHDQDIGTEIVRFYSCSETSRASPYNQYVTGDRLCFHSYVL